MSFNSLDPVRLHNDQAQINPDRKEHRFKGTSRTPAEEAKDMATNPDGRPILKAVSRRKGNAAASAPSIPVAQNRQFVQQANDSGVRDGDRRAAEADDVDYDDDSLNGDEGGERDNGGGNATGPPTNGVNPVDGVRPVRKVVVGSKPKSEWCADGGLFD